MFLINGWIITLALGALYHMRISPVHYGYWACALICLIIECLFHAVRRSN